MAEEKKKKDKAPVKGKAKKKKKTEKPEPAAEATEEKVVEKLPVPVVRPKRPGFFSRIFQAITSPFVRLYDRIILAVTNTLRRIFGLITGIFRAVGRFFRYVGTKLWEIMKKVWVVLKKVLLVALVLGVIAGGFFLGLYLRLFDLDDVNRKLLLYKWPVIGQNFVEPPPLEEPKIETEPVNEMGKNKDGKIFDVRPQKSGAQSAPIKITKEDVEKQLKEAAKAEKKRIAKLARLYENMKPQEAADIMDELDDTAVVAILQRMDESQAAKILAKLDPEKSARLTRIIFAGSTSLRRGLANR